MILIPCASRILHFSLISYIDYVMDPRTERHASLEEVLTDIILARGVERNKHELLFEGKDVTAEFLRQLERQGFRPTTVGAVDIQPGERIPAFYIKDSTAYFGWVFWEKFTELRLRKLWGSIVRNNKGDWALQIPPNKPTTIHANTAMRYEMDIDHPF